MRRFRSITERMASTQRTMTPGAGAGQTPVVAPQPRPLPKPETLAAGGSYTPLEPWGYPNPEGSSWGWDGWVGLHRTQVEAAAGDPPFLDFGVSTDGDGQVVGLVGVSNDWDNYFEWRISDTEFWLWAEVEGATDTATLWINVDDAGGGTFQTNSGTDGGWFWAFDPSSSFLQMYGTVGLVEVSADDVGCHIQLAALGDEAYFGMSEGTAPGAYNGGNPTNRGGQIWIEDNGSGKSRLRIQFNGSAAQTIITEA